MAGLPDDSSLDPGRSPRLARDLARIADARIEVPPEVDRAIVSAAYRRLEDVGTPRWRLSRGAWWMAAAAAVAGAVWLGTRLWSERPARQGLRAAAAGGDVDGNGHVDILDAFALARQLRDGAVAGSGDMNGDGRIDRADVDLIALRAVRLDRRSG